MTEGPPSHSLPPLRVQAPMQKGDSNIAALQVRRERQLQGESAGIPASRARDNAPESMQPSQSAHMPQTPLSQDDSFINEIMSDYVAQSPTPVHTPPTETPEPPPAVKTKTATIGRLAAAMGIPMAGVTPKPEERVVTEDEMFDSTELNTSAFLRDHTSQQPMSSVGLAAAAIRKLTPKP